jgi:hypothetical protein
MTEMAGVETPMLPAVWVDAARVIACSFVDWSSGQRCETPAEWSLVTSCCALSFTACPADKDEAVEFGGVFGAHEKDFHKLGAVNPL